jgi:NADH-quinone oxidoreductase subunit L
MGGLFRKIPITAICFIIGGMSLAGLPFITAGFWSKDEILADALMVGTQDGIYWLHLLVFLLLTAAAVLTAFYTTRLLLLTFANEPRSEAAKYATLMAPGANEAYLKDVPYNMRWLAIINEDAAVQPHLQGTGIWLKVRRFFTVYRDSFPIQLPLVLLAFFAITAGWVGIHPDFDVLTLIVPGDSNFFKDFIKYTIMDTPEAPRFSWWPVLTSILAATIGIGAGVVVYRKGLASADAKDPMQEQLGDETWLWLQNRGYWDDYLLKYLYVPFEAFARRWVYKETDKETIDGLLESTASGAEWLGEAIKRFNYVVIDGIGDGIPQLIGVFGRWFRSVQSGYVQQYMLFIAVALLAMGALLVLQIL